ncbi:hypothetical protein [Chitinophaga arvensicola]|uniref:Uncharacterized protein n=1 Tax=Chitinophaga arvensicola TaxID=29529 RepID=A0A1I0S819_9BACT|nr:hypothetical protein [Chitinophaga arvensicola]SEW51991.1 hypothetical protein SAMN04488122_4631 [Chitinophaga arvensicola]
MGHRTYLIATNKERSEVLFEANNLLPFFWLTLLRLPDLEQAEPAMRKAYQWLLEEQAAENAVIRVPKTAAIANGLATCFFMEDNFPDKLAFYRDFIQYLDKHTREDDSLELDVLSLAGFEGIDTFIGHLKSSLLAIEMYEAEKVSGYFNENEITALVGFGDFPGDRADQYTNAFNPRRKPPAQPPAANITVGKASLPAAIGVIIAGAALLYVPYKGFLKEGITLAVIFCALAAVTVLFMGCRKLVAAIRK